MKGIQVLRRSSVPNTRPGSRCRIRETAVISTQTNVPTTTAQILNMNKENFGGIPRDRAKISLLRSIYR